MEGLNGANGNTEALAPRRRAKANGGSERTFRYAAPAARHPRLALTAVFVCARGLHEAAHMRRGAGVGRTWRTAAPRSPEATLRGEAPACATLGADASQGRPGFRAGTH
ncbi:hypothetical protein SKAU_G00036840 [Synaphobranchus kaupii]|uniref:Uncharacterized protein n=1 Tax=Synaphobranchus kaupii TaxID=118154 RepID=A0A9Q1GEQ0_SYNKA|nr:hypothetical protein SKAU_G00036840 [Synaphobranchus kaupii]